MEGELDEGDELAGGVLEGGRQEYVIAVHCCVLHPDSFGSVCSDLSRNETPLQSSAQRPQIAMLDASLASSRDRTGSLIEYQIWRMRCKAGASKHSPPRALERRHRFHRKMF